MTTSSLDSSNAFSTSSYYPLRHSQSDSAIEMLNKQSLGGSESKQDQNYTPTITINVQPASDPHSPPPIRRDRVFHHRENLDRGDIACRQRSRALFRLLIAVVISIAAVIIYNGPENTTATTVMGATALLAILSSVSLSTQHLTPTSIMRYTGGITTLFAGAIGSLYVGSVSNDLIPAGIAIEAAAVFTGGYLMSGVNYPRECLLPLRNDDEPAPAQNV